MSETTTRSRGLGRRSTPKDGPRATFSQLLPYIFEQKGVIVAVIVLSVLGAAASLAQPLLVSNLITLVQAGDDLGNLVTILIALVVISALISGYQHYLLQRTGESVVLASRKRLIGRMLHLPIAQFDSRRTGDLVSRVGSDTTLLRAVLTQGLVDSVGGVLLFVGALIAMLVIDPVLLGATALVIAVSIVVVTLLSGRIREASHATQAKVGELSSGVERSISAVRTVRASNATDREIATVEQHAVGAYEAGVKVARISALVVPVAGIALQVSLLVVLGLGGFRVASGDIEIGSLVAFIMLLFMLIAPLGSAFGALTSVNSALGALGRIQEIIDLPTEDQNDRDLAPLAVIIGAANDAVLPDAPAIEFRDVQFSYPATSVIVEPSEAPAASLNPLVELDELSQTRCAGRRRGCGCRRRCSGRRPPRRARTASRSPPRAASARPSWGRRALARAPSSPSSSASTTPRAARCDWAASTSVRSIVPTCVPRSATSSRTLRCSPGRSATTSCCRLRMRRTSSASRFSQP